MHQSLGLSCGLSHKEIWQHLYMYRLQRVEWSHCQGCLPAPSNWRLSQCSQRWQMVLYNGPNVRLLADRDGAWRHTEGSIHLVPGTARVQGHALWLDQCPCNLWETHGECPQGIAVGGVPGVHRQHHHSCGQCAPSSGEDGTCLPATSSSWSQTETNKVFFLLQKCELPWPCSVWTRSSYGVVDNPDHHHSWSWMG